MTMTTNSTAAAALVQVVDNNTTACIVSLMGTMPPDDRDRLMRRYGSANVLRQWRLDDRDAAIRQLAAGYAEGSGRALADVLHRDLLRYAASGYRVNPAPPADDRRAMLHRVLDLIGGGKVPSAVQLRSILAGVR
jgi:hypothetical protein